MKFIDANAHSHQIAKQKNDSERPATSANIADLESEIEKLKADMTWRIVIAMSVLTGIIVAVVKLP